MNGGRLEDERLAGGDKHHRIGRIGDGSIEAALRVAEPARQGIFRHDAGTDFIGDADNRSFRNGKGRDERSRFRLDIGVGEHQVGKPQRQAMDENRAVAVTATARMLTTTADHLGGVAAATATMMMGTMTFLFITMMGP